MEKRSESTLQAVAPNQALYVAVLAPGLLKERTVWTRAVHEDCSLHQIEEVVFALFESSTEDRSAFSDRERIAEEGREAAEKPKPYDEVVQERPPVLDSKSHSPRSFG